MKLIDYHIHSHFSSDSSTSIGEIVKSALSKNISEIAITDHFEPISTDRNCDYYDPKQQYVELEKVRDKYSKVIRIRRGIELGQPHRFIEESLQVLDNNTFDFVLASAHKNEEDIDVGMRDYMNEDVDKIMHNYLDELLALAQSDMYDCIGHLDLVKRYAARQGVIVSLMKYRDRVEEILKAIIQKGKGIEVNTSGLRDASHLCMPDLDILSLYRGLGGEIITIGSDSHRAIDVGEGVIHAVDLLKDAGFNYITVFDERRPMFTPIIYRPRYYSFAI